MNTITVIIYFKNPFSLLKAGLKVAEEYVKVVNL
jgi:hypothetical protein